MTREEIAAARAIAERCNETVRLTILELCDEIDRLRECSSFAPRPPEPCETCGEPSSYKFSQRDKPDRYLCFSHYLEAATP